MQRRQFLRNSVAGGLGVVFARSHPLFASQLPAGGTAQTQPGPVLIKGKADDLKLNPADNNVLGFLEAFGNRALFTGGCVAGKSAQSSYRVSHILALISSLDNFQSFVAQSGAITGNGMSIGNTICFNYLQTTYELEALLPDAFSARLANIQAGIRDDGTPMVYAHEALLYEPATGTLTDPFKAMAGRTGRLKRIITPDGYGDLLGGNLDTVAFRLLPSSLDQSALNTVLASPAKDSGTALDVTSAFLQNLSYDTQVNAAAAVATQCGTRLVRSSIQTILGCDSLKVAGNFAGLRARITANITDGSVWHALFQGWENPPNGRPKAASLAMGGDNVLAKYLTMQELTKVGTVKSNAFYASYV